MVSSQSWVIIIISPRFESSRRIRRSYNYGDWNHVSAMPIEEPPHLKQITHFLIPSASDHEELLPTFHFGPHPLMRGPSVGMTIDWRKEAPKLCLPISRDIPQRRVSLYLTVIRIINFQPEKALQCVAGGKVPITNYQKCIQNVISFS